MFPSSRLSAATATLKLWASTVSTEPISMLVSFASGILFGAGIGNALLFRKICLYELGFNEASAVISRCVPACQLINLSRMFATTSAITRTPTCKSRKLPTGST